MDKIVVSPSEWKALRDAGMIDERGRFRPGQVMLPPSETDPVLKTLARKAAEMNDT